MKFETIGGILDVEFQVAPVAFVNVSLIGPERRTIVASVPASPALPPFVLPYC